MLHIGPLKLMSLANYNSHQSACFPVTVFVILNIVALTTTVFLQIWSTSEKNKGREKNKGKKQIYPHLFLLHYICASRKIGLGLLFHPTHSLHTCAHTHTHWQSCLLFWALCLLSLLLVSRLCVCQWCCFLPTSGTAASHESAPFSSVFIDRVSLCVSQLVPLSLYFPSFWTHVVCINPFFPHSETGISQCTVIPTR